MLLDAEPDGAPESQRARRAAEARQADFLAPIMALGRHQIRVGLAIGLAGALLVHGAAAAKGVTALFHMAGFASMTRISIVERLRASYDIDVTPPPQIEAPEPEPEPDPEPEKKLPDLPQQTDVPKSDNPYNDPPPEAAEAGKVLTAEPDPDAPLDLTGNEFVTGTGDRYAGGTTASDGTSKTAVRNPKAGLGGKPGGTGTAPAPAPPPPKQDLSKSAGLVGSSSWNDCGFPAEADMEQIDYAVVTLSVTVGVDGRPQGVSVLSDPGHGFGRLARSCALRKRYTPGLDKSGKPMVKTTPPIRVRFTR